jgi:hypothetical protein
MRRSSGGGGVIKAGDQLEASLIESSPSPPRGRKGVTEDNDDTESIVFMEHGRQVYDSSRARGKAAAATDVAGATKARPTTAKSALSGTVRPSSA